MMNWRILPVLAATFLLYLTAGAYLFQYLETKNLQASDSTLPINFTRTLQERFPSLNDSDLQYLVQEVLAAYTDGTISYNSNSTNDDWSLAASFFFVGTIVTTIGYGNVAPLTIEGRVFTIVYGLVGIPLCLVLLAGIGERLVCGFKKIEQKCGHLCKPDRCTKFCHFLRIASLICIGWVLFVNVPAVCFMYMEEWRYVDSVYYCFVTLSTIGFGDYVPNVSRDAHNNPGYRVATMIWVYMGLAWLSSVITLISEIMEKGIDEGKLVQERVKNGIMGLFRNASSIGKDTTKTSRLEKDETHLEHKEHLEKGESPLEISKL